MTMTLFEPEIQARDLARLDDDVLSRPLSPETIHAMYGAIDVAKRLTREIESRLAARAKEFIQENGEFVCGETRYYVGKEKSVKCRDVRTTLHTLLGAFGGDLDRVTECLASGAFKHGQVRASLANVGSPAAFDALFETTEEMDVKNGKPLKSVQRVNKNFLR